MSTGSLDGPGNRAATGAPTGGALRPGCARAN